VDGNDRLRHRDRPIDPNHVRKTMKTVTVTQVENGYVVKDEDKTYIASTARTSSYSRNDMTLQEVLDLIFKKPESDAA
jgi:hypothetical protein